VEPADPPTADDLDLADTDLAEPDVDLDRIACVEDLHDLARARLTANAYDYYRSGAGDEWTLRRNTEAFADHVFAKRVLVDVSTVDASIDLLGTRLDAPVFVCPTAMHRLACPDGEVATARAVAEQGSLYVMSSLCTRTPEEVAATGAARWFQLYVQRDRAWTGELADRVREAGFTALVLTADTPVFGDRWSDVRRPFELPAGVECTLLGGDPSAGGAGLRGFADAFDPTLTWDVVGWLAERSGLPVVVKGVLTGDDGARAVDAGAAAVVVSNHGGRQLDRDPATLDVLPEVAAAVAGRVPVLLDGGVRCGADVVTALCLGADAVGVGRPVLWGLAAAGRAGAAKALELLSRQTVATMRQLGTPTLADLTPERLRPAPTARR
jgi:4-hydroxymandelate oxidase